MLDTATAPTFGTRLLADLRPLFAGRDRVPTAEILETLTSADEGPWGDLGGKPLDSRRLSRELSRYGVSPAAFNTGRGTAKGYTTYPTTGNVGLADAWDRYLPAEGSGNSGNCGNRAGQDGYRAEQLSVIIGNRRDQVTDPSVTAHPIGNPLSRDVTEVTEITDPTRPTGLPGIGNRRPSTPDPYDPHSASTNGAAA